MNLLTSLDAAALNNLWPKIEMKLPRWVSIALAILILITLAKVIVGFFDSGSNKVITIPTTAATTNVKPQPRVNHDRKIAQLHLMGKPAPASTTKQVENAPETTLNLKLLGVLAGGKDYGYAIISSGGNKIKHYALGDDVPGGATLHAVFSDRVILERDIRMETLRLPRANAKGFNQKKPVNTTKAATTPQQTNASGAETNFETIGQFRQEIMKNPVRLTEFINAAPENNEDGKFIGYKLTPSNNSDMFYQLGLQPGDVVININDILLDAPNKGPEAMQALSTATEVKMVVMREGTEITLLQDMSQ
ncbi:MAG: type II secretion system protein GspC [Gammaproteobacteria bacterium]|nr:type II secretion system protein GspC [Gammaproteobacteria bacterium]